MLRERMRIEEATSLSPSILDAISSEKKNKITIPKNAITVEIAMHLLQTLRPDEVVLSPTIRSETRRLTAMENPAVAKVAKSVYTDMVT